MKHKLEILKGNQGFVVTINDYRITPTRRNGIMNILKSWDIDKSIIQEALQENLKTSPNKDFTASPKVCPNCKEEIQPYINDEGETEERCYCS